MVILPRNAVTAGTVVSWRAFPCSVGIPLRIKNSAGSDRLRRRGVSPLLQVRVAWGLPTKAIRFAACRL